MTRQRLILSINLVFFIAFATTPEAQAWWSGTWGTHERITTDVLNASSVTKDEYPDLIKFSDQLETGANTESHNIPDGDLETQQWLPDSTIWFTAGMTSDGQEGALSRYSKYDYADAYLKVG